MTEPWRAWRLMATVQVALIATMAAATLLASTPMLELFGVGATSGAVLYFRAFGASLIPLSILHWALRDSKDARIVRALLLANAIEDGLLAGFTANAIREGAMGPFGWLLFVVFAAEVVVNAWMWRLLGARTSEPSAS